ncbi:Uma2 family endonuclease [uncultured Imperialibacter sp.]|uniref:Uma2 family endonuclease n=1 Tax=uncultured Imperialibacter sp. TaxID=1672639 RepID=UPI0030D8DEA3
MPEENIDDITLLDSGAAYSYADYLRWTFEDRVELIKGKIFHMSPGPSRSHQKVSASLGNKMYNFLEGHPCEVYFAPFDVRLPSKKGSKDKEIFNVVQPDIMVVCDQSKLDDMGCIGAPDLVVEILSPFTAAKDLKNKYSLYEESGVREYWVVYPGEEIIEIFALADSGKFELRNRFVGEDKIQSVVLVGFSLKVKDIF